MKYIRIITIAIVCLTSCQKVIHIDLNTANPQVVIEANLYEGTHDFKVHITKTTSYFNPGLIPAVLGADVSLSANGNPAQPLVSTGNGWYELVNYTATANTNYTLSVVAEGKTFTATSYLPISPIMDSLTYKKFTGGFGGGKIDPYLMTAHFQDSLAVGNYYRIIVTKNDSVQNQPFDLYLLDDKLRDGEYFHAPVFSAFCDIDDTMDVELLSMDKNVFDYYTTLSDIITGDANNSAAPANPTSNWTNKALGYFGAFSTQKKSIRIK